MSIKKILSAAGVLAVCGGAVLSITAFSGKAKVYSTQTAGHRNISEIVEATGDVHGDKTMTYYSDVTAPVSFYELEVGDAVTKGEKVVGYDPSDLVKALDQAQLSSESAKNTMNGQVKASDSNQAKFNKAVSDIEIYRNTYALFRMAGDYIDQDQYQENWDINCIAAGINKNIADKTGQINSLKIELEKAELEGDTDEVDDLVDRIKGLNKDIADLNSDLAGLPPANLSPEEYAQKVIDGNWMSDIMRNWTESSTLRNTYESQILNSYQKEQLKNSYDLSTISVDMAQENVLKASEGITAEYDGIVTESFINRGSVVSKGSPLFTVESSDVMKVDVGISKYDIGKIATGQRASVDIAGKLYAGTVTEVKRLAVAKDSDKAKVVVSVTINEPDENVFIGLEADVTIFTDEKSGALAMPLEAYYADDTGDYCYVIRNGVVEKQYITTGIKTDDQVEVITGLNDGDVVITDAITDDSVGSRAQGSVQN
ncbi:MAG: efflux RND transporter periplasmic adaptor subunit [Lachnospiraceae bacterium]|nr:efflux RND transporter periplasmic adaptor subunit [Lachnospiraceae bacterium]